MAEAWDRTKDAASIASLELFIANYKDTYYAGLARLRLEELRKFKAFSMAMPVTLRLQNTFYTSDASSRDLNDIVQELTTLSGGKVQINLYPAAAIVPIFGVLDALDIGNLDAAWIMPVLRQGTRQLQ